MSKKNYWSISVGFHFISVRIECLSEPESLLWLRGSGLTQKCVPPWSVTHGPANKTYMDCEYKPPLLLHCLTPPP